MTEPRTADALAYYRAEAAHWRGQAGRLLGLFTAVHNLARTATPGDTPPEPPDGTRFVHNRTGETEWTREANGWFCGPQRSRSKLPDGHAGAPCANCPTDWPDVDEILAGREPKYITRLLPGEGVLAVDGTPLLLRCGRCKTPVGLLGTSAPFCDACIDRCHEATEFDHSCPVCQHAAVVAKQDEEAGRG